MRSEKKFRGILAACAVILACSEDTTQPEQNGGRIDAQAEATMDASSADQDATQARSDSGNMMRPDRGEMTMDSGSMMRPDRGEMPLDAGNMMRPDRGEMTMDSGSMMRPDRGVRPTIDAGLNRDARVRPDLGLRPLDGGLPLFDGSLPRFDGSLPSFDGNFPMLPDAGARQTTVTLSTSMMPNVWLNLMPIVAADPVRVQVTFDFNNSGSADDLLSIDQATLLILVANSMMPGIPRLFNQSFDIGPPHAAPPGQSTKTLNKTLGTGMPGTVNMPMELCNQNYILTVRMSNGEAVLAQGTTSCVF